MRITLIIAYVMLTGAAAAVSVLNSSGHHFAFGSTRDNAFIGLDFGRNPYGRSVSFATNGGRRRLTTALERAVEARETRMSFDFGFDFRSVVQIDDQGRVILDNEVIQSIRVFLEEVEAASVSAERMGGTFEVDVVMTDFRLADGIEFEGSPPLRIGEFPDLITNPIHRSAVFAALEPVFKILGNHPLVTLNLMNEPENISMSSAQVLLRIGEGRWPQVRFSAQEGNTLRKAVSTQGVVEQLERLDGEAYFSIGYDPSTRAIVLGQAAVAPGELDAFLIEMQAAILEVAPKARVTVGWIDDLSAMVRTKELEDQAGREITNVISFHVYDVSENPYHPVLTRRENFEALFGDKREYRITEWGLGGARGTDEIRQAILSALEDVQERGFEGVLFWWDSSHEFDQQAYLQAHAEFTRDRLDYDADGVVGFGDFVLFASGYGILVGEAGYEDRFDLNGNGRVGFGDFISFARSYQER